MLTYAYEMKTAHNHFSVLANGMQVSFFFQSQSHSFRRAEPIRKGGIPVVPQIRAARGEDSVGGNTSDGYPMTSYPRTHSHAYSLPAARSIAHTRAVVSARLCHARRKRSSA